MGQLLTEKKNGTVVTTMTYDNYGNIRTKNGTVYTYDTTWKDKLTKVGTKSIVYDASGNPTNYLGTALTWEKGRQLKNYGSYAYRYNKDGIRTQKIENGKTHDYILDGTSIIKEIVNNGDASCQGYTNEYLYDIDGSVCGIIYNGTAYYFYKNLQGDVIAIADSTGTVKAAYTYDAWGKCTVVSDTSGCNIANINPFRYRGYYYDVETGLYYLQSRYYDPEIGRFINSDNASVLFFEKQIYGVGNVFCYANNNVLNRSDFDGYFSILSFVVSFGIDAIIWAVFSSGAIAWTSVTQPIKAAARIWGKELLKKHLFKAIKGFWGKLLETILKISSKLVPIIKKAVGWLFRKWAAKLTAQSLASTIIGGIGSISINNFLNAIIPNITMFLSIGGFIAGLWDYFSDKSLDGWIKLF